MTATTSSAAAVEYVGYKWAPIRVPFRSKVPEGTGWQNLRLTLETLGEHFNGAEQNVGVLTGEPSDWLTDIDLDSMEGIRLADAFLPGTATFGRAAKPRSHWLFRALGSKPLKIKDPSTSKCLLEIRSTGQQTVFPGSIHESGEPIDWTNACRAPSEIAADDLLQRVRELAAACLLLRYWPDGGRHSCYLHLSGGLLASGWDADRVAKLVRTLCHVTGSHTTDKHVSAVYDTAKRLANGENVTGWPSLAKDIDKGEQIVEGIQKLLGLLRRVNAPETKDGKPVVALGERLSENIDKCIEALARLDVFQRGGVLVNIVRHGEDRDGVVRPDGTPRIRVLPTQRLHELLSDAAVFMRLAKQGEAWTWVEVNPPSAYAGYISARGEWAHIRPLDSIVDWPVLRPDGTVLSSPGYDRATRVICACDVKVEVPEQPTTEEARRALAELLAVGVDFPFESDLARAAWVSALLTPFARPAIAGPVPLTLFDGNQRGVGKSLLADLIGMIARGQPLPRRTAPEEPAEWKKVMLAIAIAGDVMVLIDNITRTLKSDSLDAALTGTHIQERILGRSEEVCLPLRTIFYASSNNATTSADLIRRSLHVRLESKCERPELRTGWTHPNLLDWVKAERPRLLRAALTVLRAYVVADRPAVTMRPMGNYEDWSRVVRAPLVWLGLPDPACTQDGLRERADIETEGSTALLRAWFEMLQSRTVTSGELLEHAKDREPLRAAIEGLFEVEPGKLPSVRRLGFKLRSMRGQVHGGLTLDATPKTEVGVRWKVVRVAADNADNPDDCGRPSREALRNSESVGEEVGSRDHCQNGQDSQAQVGQQSLPLEASSRIPEPEAEADDPAAVDAPPPWELRLGVDEAPE